MAQWVFDTTGLGLCLESPANQEGLSEGITLHFEGKFRRADDKTGTAILIRCQGVQEACIWACSEHYFLPDAHAAQWA